MAARKHARRCTAEDAPQRGSARRPISPVLFALGCSCQQVASAHSASVTRALDSLNGRLALHRGNRIQFGRAQRVAVRSQIRARVSVRFISWLPARVAPRAPYLRQRAGSAPVPPQLAHLRWRGATQRRKRARGGPKGERPLRGQMTCAMVTQRASGALVPAEWRVQNAQLTTRVRSRAAPRLLPSAQVHASAAAASAAGARPALAMNWSTLISLIRALNVGARLGSRDCHEAKRPVGSAPRLH